MPLTEQQKEFIAHISRWATPERPAIISHRLYKHLGLDKIVSDVPRRKRFSYFKSRKPNR